MTENPENPDITHETERRARLTWSLLAEPSDAVALMARERLGSRAALELAREATPAELLAALDGQVPAEAADPGAGTPGAGEDICDACSGSGKQADGKPCPQCGGSGKVMRGIGGG